MRIIVFILINVVSATVMAATSKAGDVEGANRAIGHGVNYGNVLDSDPPQGWGLKVDLEDFARIAQAGFKSVRIPVRWERNISSTPPFTIDKKFFDLVDSAVNAALRSDLTVILNVHHYDALNKNPDVEKPRFLAMWSEIAAHYKTYSPKLYFEILNEPHDQLTPEKWRPVLLEALKLVRQTNPERLVVIEGAPWASINALVNFEPALNTDTHLLYSFHYYDPFKFTHQGAQWVKSEDMKKYLGTRWTGSSEELAKIEKDFERVAEYSKKNHVPIFLGEFGAYNAADHDSRVRWTSAVAKLADRYGFSTCYWEFKSGFGLYSEKTKSWNPQLRDAALGR